MLTGGGAVAHPTPREMTPTRSPAPVPSSASETSAMRVGAARPHSHLQPVGRSLAQPVHVVVVRPSPISPRPPAQPAPRPPPIGSASCGRATGGPALRRASR